MRIKAYYITPSEKIPVVWKNKRRNTTTREATRSLTKDLPVRAASRDFAGRFLLLLRSLSGVVPSGTPAVEREGHPV
jgi:hypothetical protein